MTTDETPFELVNDASDMTQAAEATGGRKSLPTDHGDFAGDLSMPARRERPEPQRGKGRVQPSPFAKPKPPPKDTKRS